MFKETTIAAISTSTGIGGIGVVRLSGPKSLAIGKEVTGLKAVTPRQAHFATFKDKEALPLDEGLLLYFNAPHSFTGEEVVELQGHGGLTVLSRVLARVIELGATPARRGEFSERAFLNGKLDLVQAEAIHDLIVSESEAQAKAAINSLKGDFSNVINTILQALIELRVYIEAAIDFSEEDIDFITDGDVKNKLIALQKEVEHLLNNAGQGKLLTDGIEVVIAGKPNAGKSSLLNALSGEETAIVTDIEGTTRDLLKERIVIDGVPLHIIDTAGIRETENIIESEGIKRARDAIKSADIILWLHDDDTPFLGKSSVDQELNNTNIPTLILINKIDLTGKKAGKYEDYLAISAKTGEGLEVLKEKILTLAGITQTEGVFSARERHLFSLREVITHFNEALTLLKREMSIELVAEELRLAQNALGEITGEFTHDELLGEIFSSFCVGK